ncbi:MAG: sugar-binding domain-containing protein [Elusimicrobiota bacterium]
MKIKETFLITALLFSLACECFSAESAHQLSITLDILKAGDSIVPFQSGMPLPSFEKQDREYIDLAGKWKKQRAEADHRLSLRARVSSVISELERESGGRHTAGFNDVQWETHVVPGVENPVPDRYQGGVWYRRQFEVPVSARGKLVKLVFEGANYVTDVWINGKWAGTHEGGYTPFAFDATDFLNYGGKNIIAARVDNIPWLPMGQEDKGLKANDKNIVPYVTCDWWNYTGILRGVYLEIAPAVSIARADVKTQITGKKSAAAQVNVVIFNRNGEKADAKLTVKIFETKITPENILSPCAKGIADFAKPLKFSGQSEYDVGLGRDKVLAQAAELVLDSFEFWSPENPKLYVLEVSLEGKGVSDRFYTQFGVREIKVDGRECKVLINREPVFLRGMSRTEVFPGEAEMDLEQSKFVYRDLKIMKDINVDFIRTGHWPNPAMTYILTDRMGFAVWEEIPAFWLDGPAFDIMRKDRKVTWQMFLEMIYKDYNRPSVMFHGTCNECSWEKERILYIQQLKQASYMVDGTRLIGQSAVASDPTDKTQVDCDVLGFTMYYGVFYGKTNVYDDTVEALEKMHEKYPMKPIIVTEYGSWSEADMSSAQEQVRIARETMRALRSHDAVAGAVWWAAFDWHTMISEPETMGVMKWDRKYAKPAYYEVQRNYALFNGQWDIDIRLPSAKKISGQAEISVSTPKEAPAKEMKYSVDRGEYIRMKNPQPGTYSAVLNTTGLIEGNHLLQIRGVGPAGQVISKQMDVIVDNTDDSPSAELLSPLNKDFVMGKIRVTALVEDDRGLAGVVLSAGGEAAREMKPEGEGVYSAFIDTAKLENGKTCQIKVTASDTGGNRTQKSVSVTVDNTPGIYVDLPFNHDWIASKEDLGDGTGYDFPTEIFPGSGSEFIYNSKDGPVKFRFGKKEPLQRNNLECYGQTLPVKYGRYTKIYMLGAMHNAAKKNSFTLVYTDGTSEKASAAFSDWWRGVPVFGEETAFFTPKHLEKDGLKKPGAGIYLQSIPADSKKVLKSIIAPKDDKLHLFAVTGKGEYVTDLPPTVKIKSPAAGDIVQGEFSPSVEIPDADVAKITYYIDGQKIPARSIDSAEYPDGEHEFAVVAEDKAKQLGQDSVKLEFSNRHNVISPSVNGKASRVLRIAVKPKYKSEIAGVSYSVDKKEFVLIKPDKRGGYETTWKIPQNFKPGSRHDLTVLVKETGGKIFERKVPFEIAVPLEGHSVKVDKSVLDWIGSAKRKPNTSVIDKGEFIWTDMTGDDSGPGNYTYPLSPSFKACADIKEVRITCDKRCLYFLIKAVRPGDWWAPYRIIGIHKEGSNEPATETLAEGGLDQVSPDGGCYGEIRVAPELACQYIIGVAGTYKGRVWNAKGELVAKKESSPSDTPEFMVDDENWENIEIAVPYSVIGNPAGQTWKFIIGMGTQDGEMLREMADIPSEWNGGGGEGEAGNVAGADPDIYDLAGSDFKGQSADLSGYDPQGKPGNDKAFSVIKNSFIEVTFE